MKLILKHIIFSEPDCYDSFGVYDEYKNLLYKVKDTLSWRHRLRIYDSMDKEVGMVDQEIVSFLPMIQLYKGSKRLGYIKKELTFFKPRYDINCNGWRMKNGFLGWNYKITNSLGKEIAKVSKEIFHLTRTYAIDVDDSEDSFIALMFVLAIDAVKHMDAAKG